MTLESSGLDWKSITGASDNLSESVGSNPTTGVHKKKEGIVLRDGTKTMAKTLRNFATEIHRLDKWSHNTLHNHKLRGLPLNFQPAQIFEKAIEILIENEGCCPECGRRFEYNTDHWISLEYVNPDSFEVICMDCNLQRAIQGQRRGFNYLNSK